MKKLFHVLLCAALAVGLFYAWSWYRDNRLPAFEGGSELFVLPGDTIDDVIGEISSQTVISRPSSFRSLLEKNDVQASLRPGHYVLTADKPAIYVVRMLTRGWQTPVNLVLSGSLRSVGEIARKIGNQLMLDSAVVDNSLRDPQMLEKYGFSPETAFALLMPDTYEMYWTASMDDVLNRQKAAYDKFWTADNVAKARALGLSRMEVSVLASIVKGESNYRPELPKIAGVYLNRLRLGMKLQADPTVAFCFNYEPKRILKRHLEVDSPYNTYKYEGLPPGPINVPSREYLEAVLNPDYGDGNIFFCADPSFNGSHRFARTLAEHNANARAFQQALTREQRKAAGK